MRQSDEQFSNMLTKTGNGKPLYQRGISIIESRFRTEKWCDNNLPGVVRYMDVYRYNQVAIPSEMACDSIANDVFEG
jgi:hypothetical protein